MVLVCKFTIELRSDKHTIFTVMDATEVDSMLQTWVIRRSLDGRDLCWRDVYGGHDKSLSHGWWILGAHISTLHRAAVVICCLIVEQRPSGRDADIIRTRLRITGSPRGREQDQPSKHKVVFLEMSTCLVEASNFSPLVTEKPEVMQTILGLHIAREKKERNSGGFCPFSGTSGENVTWGHPQLLPIGSNFPLSDISPVAR